jgi:hypothetical protein
MDNREANIDLVFRNGLKDYEVLPPAEVWDNIQPKIARNQKPFIILRAAALAAAVVSLGFFAYQWGSEKQVITNNQILAFNPESEAPAFNTPVIRQLKRVENALIPVKPVTLAVSEPADNPVVNEIYTEPLIAQAVSDIDSETINEERNAEITLPSRPEAKGDEIIYPALNILTSPDQPGIEILKEKQRWSIAALASPAYYSEFTTGNDYLASQLKSSEDNVMSYSGGVSFAYKVNKRFSIQSGIYYSSIGQVVEGVSAYTGFQVFDFSKGDRNFEVLTTNGIIYTTNADVFLLGQGPVEKIMTNYSNDVFDPVKSNLSYLGENLRQNLSYLELPVLMRYKIVDRTIDLNLIGGISYNMLIANSVSTVIKGEKYMVGETDGLNPLSLSSSLGMGMEYSISDKFTLNVEPTFRYYMNPFSNIAGMNVHPYSFGIFSGVSYKF